MWDVHSPGYVDEIRLSELIILRKIFEIEAAYFKRHELSILSKKCHNMANFLNLVIALRRLNGLLKGSLEKPNRVNHAIFTQALNIFSTMICIRLEVNDSLVANTSANDVFLHHSDLDVFSLKRFFAEDYEKIGLKQIDVMPHLNQFLDYLLLLYALRPLEVARSLFQQASSKTLQALSLVIKDYAGKCKRVRGVVLDEIRGVLEERQVRERKESVKGRRTKHSTSI